MNAPLVLDSVTRLTADHRGHAAYCASHGGTYAAWLAANIGVGAVILNDAGIGRAQAGVAGLTLLESIDVPAAAISHRSARIGDGADGYARGVVSFINGAAGRCGLRVGMPCAEALLRLSAAPHRATVPLPALTESRFEIAHAGRVRVIGIDSTSLVTPDDVGQIIVTGSHGGLLGNVAASAVKYDVLAAVFNDAGGGIDDAGFSRLPALDARGIAGACVSCFSARIGVARSTYEDGVVSAVNATAAALGGAVGQSCQTLVAALLAAAPSRGP